MASVRSNTPPGESLERLVAGLLQGLWGRGGGQTEGRRPEQLRGLGADG